MEKTITKADIVEHLHTQLGLNKSEGQYAYRDRRVKKRVFRALWIVRINAAARENGLTYSKLIAGLFLVICLDQKHEEVDLVPTSPDW